MRKQPFSRQSEEKRDFVLKIAIVDDLSSVWVQYLALPCFGVLFKLIVDAESGMIHEHPPKISWVTCTFPYISDITSIFLDANLFIKPSLIPF